MKHPLSLALLVALLLAGCASQKPPAGHPSSLPPSVAAGARDCVALAMYWEARGEGRDGMAAVGAVVDNRVKSHAFPNDHCSVVYQGGETPPCQFSWWCDGKSDRPTNQAQWALALGTAEDLLAGRISDPTKGALFFHSTAIRRPWNRTQTARIGNHVFYR
ncbi:MAG: cell wall hydrolase [Pseudomonadales bacterium]